MEISCSAARLYPILLTCPPLNSCAGGGAARRRTDRWRVRAQRDPQGMEDGGAGGVGACARWPGWTTVVMRVATWQSALGATDDEAQRLHGMIRRRHAWWSNTSVRAGTTTPCEKSWRELDAIALLSVMTQNWRGLRYKRSRRHEKVLKNQRSCIFWKVTKPQNPQEPATCGDAHAYHEPSTTVSLPSSPFFAALKRGTLSFSAGSWWRSSATRGLARSRGCVPMCPHICRIGRSSACCAQEKGTRTP